MKMKYEKPMAAVDRYELSQSIAACFVNVNLASSACFLSDDDVTPQIKDLAAQGFFVDPVGCLILTVEGATYDGICIHTSANGIFRS